MPQTPTCAPLLCAVTASYPDFGCGGLPTVDEDSLACALGALRDRTPGVVTWELGGGYCGSFGYTVILADGRAINRSISYFDNGSACSDVVLGPLLSSSKFADCAELEELDERLACLETTVVGSPVVVCEDHTLGAPTCPI